jgi:hypothetical protein
LAGLVTSLMDGVRALNWVRLHGRVERLVLEEEHRKEHRKNIVSADVTTKNQANTTLACRLYHLFTGEVRAAHV